jgi:hypothetical protein
MYNKLIRGFLTLAACWTLDMRAFGDIAVQNATVPEGDFKGFTRDACEIRICEIRIGALEA